MKKNKFESMLMLIVPEVVKLILEKYKWDEIIASEEFYNSKVYEKLEEEETK